MTNVPLAGIDLDVVDSAGSAVAVTGDTTLADGTFEIILPGPGSYYLRADLATGAPLVDQYYNNAFLRSQATPINVPASDTVVAGLDFALRPGYAIAGRVTRDGTGLAGIDLDLYAGSGEFLGSYPARTNGDGTFLIGALPTGTYFLKADPDPLLGQFEVFSYFGDTREIATATPIQVGGASVTGIVWSLRLGGTFSGRISAPDGTPLESIDLDVFDAAGSRFPITANSQLDGTYAVGGLPPGQYTVRADPAMTSGYGGVYFGGNSTPSSALPLSVQAGADTAGIDMQLPAGGWITGVIRKAGGAPVAGIDLDVFDSTGVRLYPTARSGADGSYAIGPLPSGPVVLRADPDLTAGVAHLYHPDSDGFAAAVPIAVPAGSAASGIDFNLPPAGWITGTIRDLNGAPLAGIDIDLYDLIGNRISLNAVSALDGAYQIGPVPAGQVIIRADPAATAGYARRYFPFSRDAGSASLVDVSPGNAASGIDFSLPPAGWLAGTVRNNLGQPLAGIDLDLFDAASGARITGGATSATDGTYLIGPLELGGYLLRADPDPGAAHVRSYWPGAPVLAGAAAIDVAAPAGVTNIDFSLVPGRSVSGLLLLPDGAPAQGVDLDVINLLNGQRLEQTATSDLAGAWVLPPVPFGSYALRADPVNSLPYLDTYYMASAFLNSATTVTVDASVPAGPLEFSLLPYVAPLITRTDSAEPFLFVEGGGSAALFDVAAPPGSVVEMRFLRGGKVVQSDPSAPFELSPTGLPKGNYLLTPEVLDVYGRKTAGQPVFIINPEFPPDIGNPLLMPVPDGTGRAVLAWASVSGASYSILGAPSPAGPWALLQSVPGDGTNLVRWISLPVDNPYFLAIRID